MHPAIAGALFPLVAIAQEIIIKTEPVSQLGFPGEMLVLVLLGFSFLYLVAPSLFRYVGRNDPRPSTEDSLVVVGKAIFKNFGRFALGFLSVALLIGIVLGGFENAA